MSDDARLKDKTGKSDDGSGSDLATKGSGKGAPIPATNAAGTPSAGKHEPANPEPGSGADRAGPASEDSLGQSKANEEGTGGDAGSGPTGAVTPEDISGDAEGSGSTSARSPVMMVVLSFIGGLLTGLAVGWLVGR
jgi:hypothetical protein